MKTQIIKFLKDEEGATAIEYGLIAGLISVVIVTAVTDVGKQLIDVFDSIKDGLTPAAVPPAGGTT